MDINQLPFNVRLINNSRTTVSNLSPVTSTDIYDGITGQLHDEGLFSPVIFGRVGEKRRNHTLSYIDLRSKIFHPIIEKNIAKLSSFYHDILHSRKYAKWNEKLRVFEPSDEIDGETGYSFFVKYWPQLKWEKNDSQKRQLRLDVVEEYRSNALYDYYLVTPAGFRDIEEDIKGNVTQDEVNDHYRSLLGLSKNIDGQYPNSSFNDNTRRSMQRISGQIFDLYFSQIKGKRGWIQNKYIKRRVENGTRSVLTAMNLTTDDLEGPQAITGLDTVVGIYLAMKAALPKTQYAFRNSFIQDVFGGNDGTAQLINPKTLKQERTAVTSMDYDLWMSDDGVNKLINRFRAAYKRHKPAIVGKHYLALVYRDEHGFRVVRDIDELPKEKQSAAKPMTWAELFYYIANPVINRLPMFVTRYPINNKNSMPPSFTHIRTTVKSVALREYNEDFTFKTEEYIYNHWPLYGEGFIDSLIPHPNKLQGLGGELS